MICVEPLHGSIVTQEKLLAIPIVLGHSRYASVQCRHIGLRIHSGNRAPTYLILELKIYLYY